MDDLSPRPAGSRRPKRWYVEELASAQTRLCVYCQTYMRTKEGRGFLHPTAMTLEHVVPSAHGGGDDRENLVVSCARCNSLRGTIHHDLFTLIVRSFMRNEVFLRNWHSPDAYIEGWLRALVLVQRHRALAIHCRDATHAYREAVLECYRALMRRKKPKPITK